MAKYEIEVVESSSGGNQYRMSECARRKLKEWAIKNGYKSAPVVKSALEKMLNEVSKKIRSLEKIKNKKEIIDCGRAIADDPKYAVLRETGLIKRVDSDNWPSGIVGFLNINSALKEIFCVYSKSDSDEKILEAQRKIFDEEMAKHNAIYQIHHRNNMESLEDWARKL